MRATAKATAKAAVLLLALALAAGCGKKGDPIRPAPRADAAAGVAPSPPAPIVTEQPARVDEGEAD